MSFYQTKAIPQKRSVGSLQSGTKSIVVSLDIATELAKKTDKTCIIFEFQMHSKANCGAETRKGVFVRIYKNERMWWQKRNDKNFSCD